MDLSGARQASGAGTRIIYILEVVGCDFAAALAKEESEEEDAQTLHDGNTGKR